MFLWKECDVVSVVTVVFISYALHCCIGALTWSNWLTLRRQMTYIYMSHCEVFKEWSDIYIYVATSVTNCGAILFTPYVHSAEFCYAVDS
jgi:hypothetical protein